jgi:pimeloyl-ACP methyl ester carboxylesterase
MRSYGQAGPPLLILHGLLGSHRNWNSIAKALSEDHRVFAADLRNHGQSPHSSDMAFAHLTADVAALIRGLDLGRVRLIGHSLGGKVAMCTALAASGLVDSIVVVDIAPVAMPDRNAGILGALRDLPLGALPNRAAADTHLASDIPETTLRQFLLTNLVQTSDGFRWQPNIETLAHASAALSDFPSFDPDMAFPGPALFLSGASAPYRVPDHQDRIWDLFPNARIEPIDGAGHWPHTEQPALFLAAVRAFFSEV